MTNVIVPRGLRPSVSDNPGQRQSLPRGLLTSANSEAQLNPIGIPPIGNLTGDGTSISTSGNIISVIHQFTSWTPTDKSGASPVLSFSIGDARYAHIGNIVIVTFSITYPSTTDTHSALISLPVNPNATLVMATALPNTSGVSLSGFINTGFTGNVLGIRNDLTLVAISNSSLSSQTILGSFIYST